MSSFSTGSPKRCQNVASAAGIGSDALPRALGTVSPVEFGSCVAANCEGTSESGRGWTGPTAHAARVIETRRPTNVRAACTRCERAGLLRMAHLQRQSRLRSGRAAHDQLAKANVENGGQEQTEQRYAEHAREDRDPGYCTDLAAGAMREQEWDGSGNERDRGHHDRAQPEPRGLERGLDDPFALQLELARKLDDQN